MVGARLGVGLLGLLPPWAGSLFFFFFFFPSLQKELKGMNLSNLLSPIMQNLHSSKSNPTPWVGRRLRSSVEPLGNHTLRRGKLTWGVTVCFSKHDIAKQKPYIPTPENADFNAVHIQSNQLGKKMRNSNPSGICIWWQTGRRRRNDTPDHQRLIVWKNAFLRPGLKALKLE